MNIEAGRPDCDVSTPRSGQVGYAALLATAIHCDLEVTRPEEQSPQTYTGVGAQSETELRAAQLRWNSHASQAGSAVAAVGPDH